MNRLMVDIETLSVRPNAVVVSIGAVAFNSEGNLLGENYSILDLSQYDKMDNFAFDTGTISWWMQQTEEARKIFGPTVPKVHIGYALALLGSLYEQFKCEEVWANGTDFDLPILKNLADRFNQRLPWSYSKARDYRTLRQLYPEIKPSIPNPVAHNALADARFQAFHLIEILKHMGKL